MLQWGLAGLEGQSVKATSEPQWYWLTRPGTLLVWPPSNA